MRLRFGNLIQATRNILPFVLLIAMQSPAAAQTPPQRLVLAYAGGPKRPAYTTDDFVHLISVVDTGGRPTGWLFDAVLFTEFQAASGRYYMPWVKGTPSMGEDWAVYLDSLFAPQGPLTRLDSAAGAVAAAAGTPLRRIGIAVMIPYPDPHGDTLRFGGKAFSMRSDSARAGAAGAYIDEVERRFAEHRTAHVALVAFYWLNEGITPADTGLVPRVARSVHARGAAFLWIPSYKAAGADRWRALGFDEAWLQPNYFFHPDVAMTRFDSALAAARATSMGLEIEFDRRMFNSWLFVDRLEPYLGALESAVDLRSKPIAVYEGAGALIQLSHAKDPWHRALYERFVRVLRPE